MSDEDESPLKFPCEFPVKAMGKTDCELDIIVVEIVRRHVYTRESKAGNYVSVTVRVKATSRAQLDAIYQDLVDCEAVIMAI
jgi:putative lipoic acid-binding regulatory protein